MSNALEMPVLPLEEFALTPWEMEVAKRTLHNGRLRASRPPIDRSDAVTGHAAYLWRMLAFYFSPHSRHHCMPVNATFYLPEEDFVERRAMASRLDELQAKISRLMPIETQPGLVTWARALGMRG